MQALLKFGAIVTAIGFLMTAFAGNEIANPSPGVVGADIGSGIGLGFGQVIGGIGVACLVIAFAGLTFQAFSKASRE